MRQSGPSGNRDIETIIKLLKTVQVLNLKRRKKKSLCNDGCCAK